MSALSDFLSSLDLDISIKDGTDNYITRSERDSIISAIKEDGRYVNNLSVFERGVRIKFRRFEFPDIIDYFIDISDGDDSYKITFSKIGKVYADSGVYYGL